MGRQGMAAGGSRVREQPEQRHKDRRMPLFLGRVSGLVWLEYKMPQEGCDGCGERKSGWRVLFQPHRSLWGEAEE